MKKWFEYPRSLTTTGIIIALTAMVLYAVEYFMFFADGAARGAGALKDNGQWSMVNGQWLKAIVLLPMLFYICISLLELRCVERKRRAQSGTLVGTYMLFKGLRLIVTLFAIAIYIYVGAPLRMEFVANMLILFLVALTLTSICHLRAERKE